MPVLRIPEIGKTIDFEPGRTLLEILVAAGIMVPSPCGAVGVCGKCAVIVQGGNLPLPTEQELDLFTGDALAQGRRLACTLFPAADLEVSVPPEGENSVILSDGYLPAFTLDSTLVKKNVTPAPGSAGSHEERIAAALGEERLPLRLLRELPWESDTLTAIYDDDRLLALKAGDRSGRLYGLAVDIGTTTVVASLLDLLTGEELAVRTAINPQQRWGFDVLSRLGFIMEHPVQGGLALQQSVVGCLNALAAQLVADTGACIEDIYNIAVAANTTMLHIFLGIDPSSLGRAPFTPLFTGAKSLPAAEIGLRAATGAMVYCLPSVSAYIGADIVAGIHVSGLRSAADTTLFIDIGTNGEMVLAHGGQLCACSCAAGPALEGMNISSGMRACTGAVEDVRLTEDGIALQTIGNAPPVGLCGSGILSAVSEFLRVGLILPRGNLIKEQDLSSGDWRKALRCNLDGKPALRLASGATPIVITQKDIRQVQLAKGALLSGFYALLEHNGLTMNDIDRVLIAGQFGAHLPVSSLSACGIIPALLSDSVSYLGNTSKSGASMALLSKTARREMESLARDVHYFELSALEGFDRLFVTCLDFPRHTC
jgi:uncharacterized 2Fe-2S/4Fe-4S cluster protein (DUF4445 family)